MKYDPCLQIRYYAATKITNQTLSMPVYIDYAIHGGVYDYRKEALEKITDEKSLIRIVTSMTPDNESIRSLAYAKLKDEQQAYVRDCTCGKGNHNWRFSGRWCEQNGDTHYRYVLHKCTFCSAEKTDDNGSFKD